MPRFSTTALVLAALLLAGRPILLLAEPGASPLRPGDPLPQLSGMTLDGRSLRLPASGRPAVVVFAFSRAAGKDTQAWNEHFPKDYSGLVPTYDVLMLESVPKLFRGFALSRIKSAIPPQMRDRTIVLFQDEQFWKQRLGVSNDDRAYVLVLSPKGHVRWSNTAQFDDREYSQLRKQMKSLLGPRL